VHRGTPDRLKERLRSYAEPEPFESSRPRLFHRAAAVDSPKDAANTVMIKNRSSLLLIDRDSARNHARDIVRALHEMIAALGAGAIDRQLLKYDVECAVTADAHTSPRKPLDQHVSRDIEEECGGHPASALGEFTIERTRLAQRTRKAVQQHTAGGVGSSESLDHHLNDQIVRDELALIHVGAGGPPERSAATPVLAEQIAGCNVGNAERFADVAGLGTLAGPGRAD